ncbi:DMT family transporter [Plasticicumulans acidivorans]|uniref:Drug/metabolite transporter (DMT)-like permease n=1 Tax=Plasticicumulans acidivorans TaxID=886464 RepID=A0A317MWN1_9GAMM|nr:DMT family transporter [Plasticicumulans acidivorans]PWV63150.1 drug/metabolite transporter (DMT)-like permease [Plasticicumulans acidivorans]
MQTPMVSRAWLRPEAVLILATLMWGTSWLPLRHFAEAGLSGMPMVAVSYSLIAVLLLPVLWRERRACAGQPARLLAILLFGGWSNAALICALSLGDDIVRVMLLFYLAPVWGVLGGWLLLGERLGGLRLLALALAVLGAALTLGVDASTFRPLAGVDWLAFSAGLSFALNNLATRAADRVPLASKTAVPLLGCALFASAASLLLEQGVAALPGEVWAQLCAFAILWIGLATVAAQDGVSRLEAGRASVLLVFELIAAVGSAALFGHKPLAAHEWAGGALVCLAALIAARGEAAPAGPAHSSTLSGD